MCGEAFVVARSCSEAVHGRAVDQGGSRSCAAVLGRRAGDAQEAAFQGRGLSGRRTNRGAGRLLAVLVALNPLWGRVVWRCVGWDALVMWGWVPAVAWWVRILSSDPSLWGGCLRSSVSGVRFCVRANIFIRSLLVLQTHPLK